MHKPDIFLFSVHFYIELAKKQLMGTNTYAKKKEKLKRNKIKMNTKKRGKEAEDKMILILQVDAFEKKLVAKFKSNKITWQS